MTPVESTFSIFSPVNGWNGINTFDLKRFENLEISGISLSEIGQMEYACRFLVQQMVLFAIFTNKIKQNITKSIKTQFTLE